MKEGNPFGPFWDNFKIDFESYQEYGPLSYNTHMLGVRDSWEKRVTTSFVCLNDFFPVFTGN